MAELLCQLHWDDKANEVVKTYQVLSTGPNDSIRLITRDSQPFIIKTKNARLAKQLGLEKASNAKGSDLYQVKPPAENPGPVKPEASVRMGPLVASPKPSRLPSWLGLECGTLENGKFKSWGGVGPKGFY